MDYKKTGQEILAKVGGKDNVKSLSHCYTRLRFSLADDSKANANAIEKIDGVMSVKNAGGQFQVIIGTEVDKVYKEILPMIGEGSAVSEDKKPKSIKDMANGVLDVFISCFTPIIPLIAGCGMIKVLLAVLLNFGVLKDTSSTYQILNFIGDSVYYFLPIFVGYTAAKKMDTDAFLGMALGAILLHPNFTAMAVDGAAYTHFLSAPVKLVSYSAQALPVILSVWLMKYVNNFFEKVCPNMVKVFLRPMLTLLVTAPIMLVVIGPIGSIMGDYFQGFCDVMNKWGWIAVGINAAIFPILVLTGMHNALIPLMIQMFAMQGFDPVLVPSGLVANIAEGGAAAAVAVRSKNKKTKGTAISATISALFGITEPALYGVNLKYKRPFVAVLLGSLIGGCFAGLCGVTAYSFVAPSILSLPIFAGGDGSSFIWAVVTVPVSFAVTFAIAWVLGFKEDEVEETEIEIADNEILAPIEGKVVALSEVKDEAFSTGALGEGCAIIPEKGEVVAPFDGTVEAIFPTGHAIGLKRTDGLELMIHIGMDTVELGGKYFEVMVKQNDTIKRGDTLIRFDINGIKKAGYDITTPIVVTNAADYEKISANTNSNVTGSEALIYVG